MALSSVSSENLAKIEEIAEFYRLDAWEAVTDDLGEKLVEGLASDLREVVELVQQSIAQKIEYHLVDTLRHLEQLQSAKVVAAIDHGFGGVNDLFLSLWRSVRVPSRSVS